MFLDKKTTKLLKSIGFQMPIELQQSGYIGNISYFKRSVKIKGKSFTDVVKLNDINTSQYSMQENQETLNYLPNFFPISMRLLTVQ